LPWGDSADGDGGIQCVGSIRGVEYVIDVLKATCSLWFQPMNIFRTISISWFQKLGFNIFIVCKGIGAIVATAVSSS
jgi:hypothetical protein